MLDREQIVTEIAQEVIARLSEQGAVATRASHPTPRPAQAPHRAAITPGDGVFRTVDEAVRAAVAAQERIAALTLEERGRIAGVIKRVCEDRKEELGRAELDETKIGRIEDKIAKLESIRLVPGVEAMRTHAHSDVTGLCVTEHAPWGVIGMVLPVTHSAPTLACNAINVISAGNAAVFSPHPAGARVAARALQLFNREIQRATGIANALTTMAEPGIQAAGEVFHHADVALLCVTGGPGVVKAAMKAGKRVIAAGPGNPPVVVDETACLDRAAESIIEGGGFDNNLLCIAEKEVFVVEAVFDDFMAAMRRAGARELDERAIETLSQAAFEPEGGTGVGCGQARLKRDLVGKDASVLAAAAGVRVPADTLVLFGETHEDHPFVQVEQMMPFLPIVRVRDIDAGIAGAVKAEHGYRHTAIIHSRDVDNVTKMARAMDTTLFVQNASCLKALGSDAPSTLSYSIATPTGEGITTPMTFTRERQITISGALRIH
jgi:aldehyde dehydrogenase